MTSLLGKKLLNYRIEKLLGQGGMGEVYLGVHTEIERKVAIKVISPSLAQDPRIRERFRREALILSRLNHPHIVQLYDFWDRPEGLFLVMEYVEGISLDRYIHRVVQGPLPFHQAIELFLQVLEAFDYAHNHGVIHRDIKPSNILIRNDQVAKVLDFGIARILSGDGTQSGEAVELTKTGTTLGTVAYMSPEQLRAKSPSEIDHRSDIYSLGIVLFEMLTGRQMYDRAELSEFEILVKIATEPPPTLRAVNPHLPQELETILQKALAKKPEDRFQDCKTFASELLQVSARYPNLSASSLPNAKRAAPNPALTQATATGLQSRSPWVQETILKLRSSAEKLTKGSPKQRLLGAIILALVILGLASLVFILISQNRSKKAALATVDRWIEAIRTHDASQLHQLFEVSLVSFFDKTGVTTAEVISGYQTFWRNLQRDSVTWQATRPPTKSSEGWLIEGELYYAYTTKPRTEKIPKKRYNRVWGRYDTYYVTETIPAQYVCKIKHIRITVKEERIQAIAQLSERNCP